MATRTDGQSLMAEVEQCKHLFAKVDQSINVDQDLRVRSEAFPSDDEDNKQFKDDFVKWLTQIQESAKKASEELNKNGYPGPQCLRVTGLASEMRKSDWFEYFFR